MIQGTRWLLSSHPGTDQTCREVLFRLETAVSLWQFAAAFHQLSGCPDTTIPAPSALPPRAPLVLFWFHHFGGSHCVVFP